MSLLVGTRLGPYEIVSFIGAGGMGEVYRARDTRLDRIVAVKISAEQFTQRFEREARAIAALNHPHICTLHDVGPNYLVMEYIEGPTLAERIRAGAIPLQEALPIARQIAEALEAAHEKGIVHRDLKPANVKFTADGNVKVLDFGLAKALEADSGATDPRSSPTLTLSATRAGVILGTAAYMSPEQARGAAVDKRADVWAFGVVLYEILTARRTFEEETVSDTLAAVLKTSPDWRALPPETPAPIRRLLRRCVERDRKKRLPDIAVARLEIDEALAGPVEDAPRQPAQFQEARHTIGQKLPWALATLGLVLAFAAVWGWLHVPAAVPRPVVRWTVALPKARTVPGATLSPDGSRLAYVGRTTFGGPQQIFVRLLDQLESKPLSGTENTNFIGHFFSPDGHWIGYIADGKLKKIPATGGASVTLCDVETFYSASWGPDDMIILSGGRSKGLSRVSAAGGKPQVLTMPDPKKGETAHNWPRFLPGGQAALFSISTGASFDDGRIGMLNLRTGEQRVLLEGGANARYAPTGHLIYARAGSLFAVAFDLNRLQVKGSPAPVLEDVMWISALGFADYSFSDLGTLVYVPGGAREDNRTMVWVDRKGAVTALAAPPRPYSNPSVSPDGQRIAVSISGGAQSAWDIWVYELARGALIRLTSGPGGYNFAPTWTPDGKRLTFAYRNQSGKPGISWTPADSSGPAEQLLSAEVPATPGSWSPDGSALVFYQGVPGKTELMVLPAPVAGAENKPRPLLPQQGNPLAPQISPDGRWIAYANNESAMYQVYVQPFRWPGGKTQISTEGGNWPRWARNGRELFYRDGDKMMAVDIETKPAFRAGRPKVLFEGRYEISPSGPQPGMGYDVSPDGQRFLMIKGSGEQGAQVQMQVVQEWFEELKRRVPTGGK